MNNSERSLLLASISDQLSDLIAHKFYFPSRVKYLDAILNYITQLDRSRRYIILALNSSVAAQQILGADGYNFRNYLRAFRERSTLGDYIVRVYCLSDTSSVSLADQLINLRAVISENSLGGCLNLLRTSSEGFNCAYFIPLADTANTDELDAIYRTAINHASADLQELMSLLSRSANIAGSVMFFEHHDYDVLNTRGCGFRFEPTGESAEARDKFSAYAHIVEESLTFKSAASHQNPKIISYRVGFIVALSIEFDAVRRQLDEGSMVLIDDSSGVSFFHSSTTRDGIRTNVVVVQLPTTGNISSALATALLVERFKVGDIFLIGIAGGLKGEVQLGDVVVGSTVVYAEKKKVLFDDEKPDYRIYEARFSELSTIHDRSRYRARMVRKFPVDSENLTVAHLGGALLCVEKVITDSQWLSNVKKRVQRKLLAVENEASGVYFAASHINPSRTRYVAVKGISDYADADKDDRWHEFAADAAAAYAVDVVHHLQRV